MNPVLKHVPLPVRRISWVLVFLAASGLTLCEGSWLRLAQAGWIFMAVLFMLHRRYALYTVFFFSAFFQPAGFFFNPWMTPKHFHMACLFLMMADLLTGHFHDCIKKGGTLLRYIFPVVFVLALGVFISMRTGFAVENLRTPLNACLTLALLSYLFGCISAFEPEERKTILKRSLLALSAGMALQVGMAVRNSLTGAVHWNLPFFHNNHLGNLCLIAFLYALAFYISCKKSWGKAFYFFLLLSLFVGIAGSCSRTAWITCFLSLLLFLGLSRRFLNNGTGRFSIYAQMGLLFSSFLGLLFLLMLTNAAVMSRVQAFSSLFNADYWRYTFADQQNFGFLGIYRLEQYRLLGDILRHHWLVGAGFIKQVTDIHGLALVILGATGVVGFSVFFAFCMHHLVRIFGALRAISSGELLLLLTAAFSAFAAWMIMSFMETFVVHFIVWVNLMMGILLVELSKGLEDREQRTTNFRPQTVDSNLQATKKC